MHVDAAGPDENRGGGSDQSRRTLIIHSPLRNSVRQERLKPKPQLFFFFFLVRLPTLAAALIIACTLLLSRCPPPSHHHPASSHGCGEFAGRPGPLLRVCAQSISSAMSRPAECNLSFK